MIFKDDSPTRYEDGYSSHSRVRLNYGMPGSSSRYSDDYGNERSEFICYFV